MTTKTLPEILGMRIATEHDFRTSESTLKLDVEYLEWMLGTHEFELQVTDDQTDMEWLKTKISLNYILIHNTPILWNQKNQNACMANTL